MTHQPIPRRLAVMSNHALTPVLIPIFVFSCTLILVVWAAWPVFRVHRSIEIAQAVFVQTSEQSFKTNPESGSKSSPQSTRAVQSAGWLEAEPFYTAATALSDGVIYEMLVLEGDHVKAGQVLARMVNDDAKLNLARDEAELMYARASLDAAKAMLVAAEQNWESPYELERAVSSGQASLGEHQARLKQLPDFIQTEEALLLLAKEELKSIQYAYERDAAAEIELITVREQARAQQARLNALRAREPILRSTITRIESDLHASSTALELRIDDFARLETARASLELAKARVAQHEAQRDMSALELERMTIKAPITGYVQRRLKVPGDKVVRMMDSPYSAHIAHLYDPSKLQVRVDVPLADASQVFVGQACEVVVEVLAGQVFKGEVLRITHEADLQKNTLQVKVRVIGPDPVLRPEMLTRVKFLPDEAGTTNTSESGLDSNIRVPEGSIEYVHDSQQVWLITDRANGQGVLRPVAVTSVSQSDGWVTIKGSVPPGAIIAADPQDCANGERVRFANAEGIGS